MNKDTERLNIAMPDSLRTEEFKRPDHYDFMNSNELKAVEFNGVRHNSLTHRMELWIVGEMVKDFLPSEKDQMLLYMAERFGIEPSQVDWDNTGGNV